MKIKMAYSLEEYELKGYNVPLLPCPFCGDTEELYVTSKKNFDESYKANGSACISMQCYNCHLELYEHDYKGRGYATKVKRLIEKWNTREVNGNGTEEH